MEILLVMSTETCRWQSKSWLIKDVARIGIVQLAGNTGSK